MQKILSRMKDRTIPLPGTQGELIKYVLFFFFTSDLLLLHHADRSAIAIK
jgi:hypothetical protein